MATCCGVKLLGSRASPYVNRVAMALAIKSIEYEFVETNAYQKTELLLKTNPIHKKVPVLVHDDRPICESLVIVQYIDDAWTSGPSILPSDPSDRAIARFWAAYIDEKWFTSFQQLREAKGEEEREAIKQRMSEGLDMLEAAFISCSKGKDFFGGDDVGYLDIVLGSYVGWLRVIELLLQSKLLDKNKIPCLVGWAEKLYADSCVKDVVLEPQMLLQAFMKFQAMSTPASA